MIGQISASNQLRTSSESELAPNMFRASSELASVMEFGFIYHFAKAALSSVHTTRVHGPCTRVSKMTPVYTAFDTRVHEPWTRPVDTGSVYRALDTSNNAALWMVSVTMVKWGLLYMFTSILNVHWYIQRSQFNAALFSHYAILSHGVAVADWFILMWLRLQTWCISVTLSHGPTLQWTKTLPTNCFVVCVYSRSSDDAAPDAKKWRTVTFYQREQAIYAHFLACHLNLLLRPPVGVRNIAMIVSVRLCVCLSVCLPVRSRISETTCLNFAKFSVHVTRGGGSVLIW